MRRLCVLPEFSSYRKALSIWRARRLTQPQSFERGVSAFRRWIENSGLDDEDFCIDGGAVLSAYGLRECADIDFLHHTQIDEESLPLGIQSHASEATHYACDPDEIIYDPANHIWVGGVKVATPAVVKRMKASRGEDKDRRDIELLARL